jgi:hypothetical protein
LMIRDQTYRADNGKWKLWQKEMDKKVDWPGENKIKNNALFALNLKLNPNVTVRNLLLPSCDIARTQL